MVITPHPKIQFGCGYSLAGCWKDMLGFKKNFITHHTRLQTNDIQGWDWSLQQFLHNFCSIICLCVYFICLYFLYLSPSYITSNERPRAPHMFGAYPSPVIIPSPLGEGICNSLKERTEIPRFFHKYVSGYLKSI